jgi:hypothetical protein
MTRGLLELTGKVAPIAESSRGIGRAIAKFSTNNVLSNYWLIKMVTPQILERRGGAIILTSLIDGMA